MPTDPRAPTAGRNNPGSWDLPPPADPQEQAAAKTRIARTEALLRQALAAETPEQAQSLILQHTPIAADSYTLSSDPACRLRLLAQHAAAPGSEPRLTLQRKEPRDDRWHELTLSAAETEQLRRFLALAQAQELE